MSKRKTKRRRCTPCETNVRAAEYIRVCRRTGKKKECKIISNKYIEEKITANKLLKEVRKLVKGNKKALKSLKEVDKAFEEMLDEDD